MPHQETCREPKVARQNAWERRTDSVESPPERPNDDESRRQLGVEDAVEEKHGQHVWDVFERVAVRSLNAVVCLYRRRVSSCSKHGDCYLTIFLGSALASDSETSMVG